MLGLLYAPRMDDVEEKVDHSRLYRADVCGVSRVCHGRGDHVQLAAHASDRAETALDNGMSFTCPWRLPFLTDTQGTLEVVTDVSLTVLLAVALLRSKTGFENTDKLINHLLRALVETQLPPTIK